MIASETVLSLICISWTMWSTFFLEILMNHYKLIKSTTVVISIFEASMRCSTYIWWLNLKTNYNTPFPGMLYFSQHEQISIFGLNSLRFFSNISCSSYQNSKLLIFYAPKKYSKCRNFGTLQLWHILVSFTMEFT